MRSLFCRFPFPPLRGRDFFIEQDASVLQNGACRAGAAPDETRIPPHLFRLRAAFSQPFSFRRCSSSLTIKTTLSLKCLMTGKEQKQPDSTGSAPEPCGSRRHSSLQPPLLQVSSSQVLHDRESHRHPVSSCQKRDPQTMTGIMVDPIRHIRMPVLELEGIDSQVSDNTLRFFQRVCDIRGASDFSEIVFRRH